MDQAELRRTYSRIAKGAESPAPPPPPTMAAAEQMRELIEQQRLTNKLLKKADRRAGFSLVRVGLLFIVIAVILCMIYA